MSLKMANRQLKLAICQKGSSLHTGGAAVDYSL
ncbi:conserved hypothethical protein (plasmid) [Ralstonia solanacearum PSI07]|uniref:Conserved hypothethical protein n=1 Tax=blood disease bacterium R229 TaxID=741978 RepID=G2ZRP9_9RALS|nr:conserved hypothethical protein [Ralstonia solanacearum PSI07]CCA81734.1 conserved hypothethical protein [blood disease bacterium R229]